MHYTFERVSFLLFCIAMTNDVVDENSWKDLPRHTRWEIITHDLCYYVTVILISDTLYEYSNNVAQLISVATPGVKLKLSFLHILLWKNQCSIVNVCWYFLRVFRLQCMLNNDVNDFVLLNNTTHNKEGHYF